MMRAMSPADLFDRFGVWIIGVLAMRCSSALRNSSRLTDQSRPASRSFMEASLVNSSKIRAMRSSTEYQAVEARQHPR